MSTARRANDLLINVDMGDNVQPDWMVRVKEDYFRADSSMFQKSPPVARASGRDGRQHRSSGLSS